MKNALQNFLKLSFTLISLLVLSVTSGAQTTISGTVIDEKDHPVHGASVYLENTIDGGTTDSTGVFRFTTSESGAQTLVVTDVSHQNTGMPLNITGDISGLVLHMRSNAHELGTVTITAGAFDASNDKGKTILKPLDIVTTAGANADVVKAIETLPGTQQTGADNGLFVRGGDASEAAILVDEMVVQNAFFSSAPGVATRSRFGAFQYQGVSFSSGGYSARYGQALSSVLELNSLDLPDKSNVNLGINMAGVYAQGTKLWKHSSLDAGASYNNLSPFYGLATTNMKFYDVPVGGGGNLRYAWKPNKKGILKITANGSYFSSGIGIPNPYVSDTVAIDSAFHNMGDTVNFRTRDLNIYSNASYKQMFKDKYSLYTAASYSYDKTDNQFGIIPLKETDQRAQFRLEGKDYINARLNLLLGTEIQHFKIEKSYDIFNTSFTETQLAGYTELEWSPINWLAIRPGLRIEHSELLNENALSPRFSMAIKTGRYSQISLAGGMFYQNADYAYLLAGFRPHFQEATHYIANWQWTKQDRTLRVEGYYKNYADLVRERLAVPFDPNTYRYITPLDTVDNSGYGYAQGLELFWRDKKTFKNVDYWISYSYIDTKRLYANYPTEAQPTFIATHNLNLVGKYWVNKLNTNFSATYTFASGRPYFKEGTDFLSSRTPDFNNFAITVSYLHTFGKWFTVFYLSVDNVTNAHNIFGYRYSADASHTLQPIVPALYRSIFFGVNMSLTQFSKDEL